ncbi:Peptidase inhibitor [Streptomyces griseus]|uniref:Peptidase inhibitor n=1 Tax=Streptomyces griseus TaxID=1911 RepID=A0A380NFE9_STRGR|nr:Peptidase inhibitor [Streptomyces griseus]
MRRTVSGTGGTGGSPGARGEPGGCPESETAGWVRGVRELAERWLPLAGRGDFVLSPAGLWLALAALSAGARGDTAAELRRMLGVDAAEAARAVAWTAATLDATDALRHATRIWSRVPLEQAYTEALPGVGSAPMDVAAVDAWVREVTHGMVERLPLRVTDETLLVLVDALVLTARWAEPFPGAATRPRDFTAGDGTVRAVPTMHRGFPAGQAWTAPGGVRVLDLPCAPAEPGRPPARVRFALGPPDAPPADVLAATWAPPAARTPIEADRVAVALPRLALRTTRDATDDVASLGAPTVLTEAADLGGLSPVPLALSQAVQESVVRVAEQGVEAAAVTALATRFGAPPPPERVEPLTFDRPFGFTVLDGAGMLPLFTAWQSGVPEDPGASREGDESRGAP